MTFAFAGGSVIDFCNIVSAQVRLPSGTDICDYEYSQCHMIEHQLEAYAECK